MWNRKLEGSQTSKIKKSRLFTCPYHKVHRVEAAGLSLSNCTSLFDIVSQNISSGMTLFMFSIVEAMIFCSRQVFNIK